MDKNARSSLSRKYSLNILSTKILIKYLPIYISLLVLLLGILFKEITRSFSLYPFLLATLPVILAALYSSMRAAFAMLVLSLISIIYFFLPPYNSFNNGKQYLIEALVFLAQGAAIIWLLRRIRKINEHLETRVAVRTKQLKDANTKLKKQRQQLLVLNKAKDEFLLMASHELRTPATAVKLYIGMVRDGYSGEITEKQDKMLGTAYDSNEKQLKIADSLLRIANIDTGKIKLNKAEEDITNLLQKIIEGRSSDIKKTQHNVEFTASQPRIKVRVDAAYLSMALDNIFDNAIKYSPEGSKIVIELTKLKSRCAVKIIDEGVGILPKDRKKIFGKFIRVENTLSVQAGGVGVGMYWSQEIIRLHKGTITVGARKGTGSIFTVYLPLGNKR